jgi:hypothetical protein
MHETHSDSPIVGPAVYYAVNCALVKALCPNLPHYHITIRRLKLGAYNNPLTLSDIANDTTGDRVHSDPNSLFSSFLTVDGTRVLDCLELLLQEYLQRTARSVRP